MADRTKTAYAQGVDEAAALFGVKISSGLVDDIPGYFVGKHFGKKQHARGEDYDFGAKQLASLALPGGIGYQFGRSQAHREGDRAARKADKPDKKE